MTSPFIFGIIRVILTEPIAGGANVLRQADGWRYLYESEAVFGRFVAGGACSPAVLYAIRVAAAELEKPREWFGRPASPFEVIEWRSSSVEFNVKDWFFNYSVEDVAEVLGWIAI